jgi:hypothetical protein
VPPQHHVLLIGIDAYDGGAALNGCVNDIDAVQRFLIDRVRIEPGRITRLAAPRPGAAHETAVPHAAPTLDHVRGALAGLGEPDRVAPGDRVLVYYSGHGTQCQVEDGRGRRFSREALLPSDHGGGERYLFDWELNALIAGIAARDAAVTVILDCCSSGGATRGDGPAASPADRFWPVEGVVRVAEVAAPPVQRRGVRAGLGAVDRCQVVAACRDDERARESASDGRMHGELTRALLHQLGAVDDDLAHLRWGRIWRDVVAAVRRANPRQSPLLAGSFGRRVFGFGPDEDADRGYAVVAVPGGFRLDVGTLAGVTEDAQVAVYGAAPLAFPEVGSAADLAARAGVLRVTSARRAEADAVAVAPFALPAGARGRLVGAGRAARLRVALETTDPLVASALATSSLVELVDREPELVLVARGEQGLFLTDDVHGAGDVPGEPVLAAIPPRRFDLVRPMVEHYHAYRAPLRLARACTDLPELLQLWLLDCTGRKVAAAAAQEADQPEMGARGADQYTMAVGGSLCFAAENRANVALSVTLIDCAPSGRVFVLGEKRLPPRSRHVFWAHDTLGVPFVASLPPGRAVGVDRFALIGTTRADVSLAHLARSMSFADFVTRGALRGHLRDDEPAAERWTAATASLRIEQRTSAG